MHLKVHGVLRRHLEPLVAAAQARYPPELDGALDRWKVSGCDRTSQVAQNMGRIGQEVVIIRGLPIEIDVDRESSHSRRDLREPLREQSVFMADRSRLKTQQISLNTQAVSSVSIHELASLIRHRRDAMPCA